MRVPGGIIMAVASLVLAGSLEAQTIEAGPVVIRLSGRVHTQFNTTSVDAKDLNVPDGTVAATTFEVRRLRFGFDAVVDGWITARLEPELAMGRLTVRNANVNFAADPALEVRVGQFKKPFSLINLTSSNQMLPIERGVRIRGLEDAARREAGPADPADLLFQFGNEVVLAEQNRLMEALGYLGNDIGLSVHGLLGRFRYEAGVFNGEGPDRRDENDAKSLAARLAYQPRPAVPLSLALSTSHRETIFTGNVEGVSFVNRRLSGTVFGLEAEYGAFRRPGFQFVAEANIGDNLALDEPLRAIQVNTGYFRPLAGERVEGVELIFRLSFADPSTRRPDNHGWLVTPGVNLYFAGRSRLMLNWDVFFAGSDRIERESALRALAQVAF